HRTGNPCKMPFFGKRFPSDAHIPSAAAAISLLWRFAPRRRRVCAGDGCLYMGAMLRLTDIKLPLGHPSEALKAAILKKLKLPAEALLDWQVFKRGHDARNKQAIVCVYTVDVRLKDESRAPKDARPTPDMDYKPVAQAPS